MTEHSSTPNYKMRISKKDKTKVVDNTPLSPSNDQLKNGETIPSEKIDDGIDSDLEKDLEAFRKRTSSFQPPVSTIPTEKKEKLSEGVGMEEPLLPSTNAVEDNMKIKMFLGFACYLLSGFATWIFNLIKKHEVEYSDMVLTELEKEQLKVYMNTPRIINFINKIPPEWIMFLHIGYIYNNKHESAVKRKIESGEIKIKIEKKKNEKN